MVVVELILKILSCIPYLLKFDWSSIPGVFQGYIFDEYKKHVTIYKNGNAIIINTFNLKVYNPEKTNEILRKLNIQDGKIDAEFPKLTKMQSTNIDDRFHSFGMWIYSDNNVVSKAKEFYWNDDNPQTVDQLSKSNPQELKFKLLLDESKLKRNKIYKITYVISVPGMYPIENGLYNSSLHSPKFQDYRFSSSIKVSHAIKKLVYIVSFENGIVIDELPTCNVYRTGKNSSTKDKSIHGAMENNCIYKKYTYQIKRPKFRSLVEIDWKIKKRKTYKRRK